MGPRNRAGVAKSAESKKPRAVGDVLRELRERAGATRSAVARRADIDPSTLYKVERTRGATNFVLVARVAKALGVSLDDIAAMVDGALRPAPAAHGVHLGEALDAIDRGAAGIREAVALAREGKSPKPRAGRRPKA